MTDTVDTPQSRLEPADVVALFEDIGRELAGSQSGSEFDALTRVSLRRIPGADAASITTLEGGRYRTRGATDERATRGDAVQYELRSGPCVDAIVHQPVYRPEDLREDDRWPEFGRRVHQELGWTSMVAFRLFSDLMARELVASLNLYARQPRAFDAEACQVGLVLATHGGAIIAATGNREHVAHLQRALENSRQIGTAIGILMATHRVTREQAFSLLRLASQHLNRKLRDVAEDVVRTGAVPSLA